MGKKATTRKAGDATSKPKPGDKDYLTPTQLRNARKRRAKHQVGLSRTKNNGDASTSNANNNNKKYRRTKHQNDPSLQYLAKPLSAPTVQAAKAFFKSRLESFPIFVGPTRGWRTVAKLAVRNVATIATSSNQQQQQQLLTIGMFAPRSHTLVEVPDCPAHHPQINAAVRVVQTQARRLGVTAFDEGACRGQLRHVALSVQRHTSAVQLTLVWTEPPPTSGQTLSPLLRSLVDAVATISRSAPTVQWHSVWVHYNTTNQHANAIFSHTGAWDCLYSNKKYNHLTSKLSSSSQHVDGIVEYLDLPKCPRIPLFFPPQVFRQANLTAFAKIVASIRTFLIATQQQQSSLSPRHKDTSLCKQQTLLPSCLELYGGVGTIGLHLADLHSTFVSSDENPYNVTCFNASVQAMRAATNTTTDDNIRYQPASAATMVESGALTDADVIIVDPPRKGLDETVRQALRKDDDGDPTSRRQRTLVYVSCGFDAFVRDCHSLTTSGWRLVQAEGHVLFPGSNAIETLAFFKR